MLLSSWKERGERGRSIIPLRLREEEPLGEVNDAEEGREEEEDVPLVKEDGERSASRLNVGPYTFLSWSVR